MELSTAVSLIRNGVGSVETAQHWADLGAGEGLFTSALSALLPKGSTIYAVDKNKRVLQTISTSPGVSVVSLGQDFTTPIAFDVPLDGMIMANSLHYVRDQAALLRQLKTILQPWGKIIFIEYDRVPVSPWVPYPVSREKLQTIVREAGFAALTMLEETPSRFNRSMLYSAVADLRAEV
jgi:ubiquinone/menaquinone biosynthesis C-methylase UbiE